MKSKGYLCKLAIKRGPKCKFTCGVEKPSFVPNALSAAKIMQKKPGSSSDVYAFCKHTFCNFSLFKIFGKI